MGFKLSPLQMSQTTAKVIAYPPQPDGKTLLLNIQLTYVTEHREIELVPIRRFTTTD